MNTKCKARYAGYCPLCGCKYPIGTLIEYEDTTHIWKPVFCPHCDVGLENDHCGLDEYEGDFHNYEGKSRGEIQQ